MSGKNYLSSIDTKFVNNLVKLMEQANSIGIQSLSIGDINIVFDSSKKSVENETAQHTQGDTFVENQYDQVPVELQSVDIKEATTGTDIFTDSLAYEKELFGEDQETYHIGAHSTL